MKIFNRFYWLSLLLFLGACASNEIKITSNFDHGSIGDITEIKPGFFKGTTRHWLKRDSIGNQYYWFYFKADNVKDKKITFELTDLEGVYRKNPHIVYTAYTEPVYSYDQESWQRIEEVKYDSTAKTFLFSKQFNREPVWIAYAHPYTFQRLQKLISFLSNNKYVEVEEISSS